MPQEVSISSGVKYGTTRELKFTLPIHTGFKDCSLTGHYMDNGRQFLNQKVYEGSSAEAFVLALIDGYTKKSFFGVKKVESHGSFGLSVEVEQPIASDPDDVARIVENLRQLISECWFEGEEVLLVEPRKVEPITLDQIKDRSVRYHPSFAALMGMIWVAFTVVFAAAMFVSAASTAASLVGASAFTLLLSVLIARAART